jgi:hypothetical protein
MNESHHNSDYTTGTPAQTGVAAAVIWPALAGGRVRHKLVEGALKARKDLPLFCNPVALFVFNWAFMMASLSAKITYVTYPLMDIPLLLCALSVGSFLFGYLVAHTTLLRSAKPGESFFYTLDVTMLWRINLLICSAALVIILFNWVTIGPPPALGDPTSYLTYGRFKQVLFPLLVTVTVNSTLDSSRWRKVSFAMFGITGMALYITRGLLMVALLQMFYVFALRTNMSKRKLYSIAFGCLAGGILATTLIGNVRTAHGVFLEYLQIREKYYDWPTVYLWLVSYVSIPFSNLCWLFAKGNYHGPTMSFLYPLLPSFLTPSDPHAAIHNDLSIIDGASTYLAAYALDFSYLGIYLANLALGLGCGWLWERSLPRQILVSGIFLACLSFIFFSDMFTPLSTILQLILQSSIQKRCLLWRTSENLSGGAHELG